MIRLFKTSIFILFIFTIFICTAQKNELLIHSGEALKKGIEAHDAGKYEEAIAHYQSIYEGDTNYLTALYEIALSTQFVDPAKAINICKDAMQLEDVQDHYMYYTILNACYDELGKHDEALETINEATEEYPNFHLMHYNKAVTLQAQEKYEEALETYKKTLEINPFHFNSHFAIGRLAANNRDYTKAIFPLSTAIIVEPNHPNAIEALKLLDELLRITYEGEITKIELAASDEDDFSAINEIIESKVVLDKKYKTQASVGFLFTNQIHAALETIKKNKKNNGWFSEKYLPVFTELYKQNKFGDFADFLFVPSSNENISKIVSKKTKELKEFRNWFVKEYKELYNKVEGKKNARKYYYNNGKVESIGEKKKDKEIGDWVGFNHLNGFKKYEGNLGKNGKNGAWKYYHSNGVLKEETEYKNGEANGKHRYYYDNGILNYEGTYKDDKLNGFFTFYDAKGIKYREANYKNSVYHGTYKDFYPNGMVKLETNFVDGLIEKELKKYFKNGAVKEISNYKNDKYHDLSKTFYNSGKLEGEYNYVDGKLNGSYTLYHQNGKEKYKSQYKDGKEFGSVKEYYLDGSLSIEKTLDENGKENGKEIHYDRKGNKTFEQTLKKGEIIAYKFFDRKGSILSEAKKKNKKFFVDNRNPDNIKVAEGNFQIGNKGKTGLWKYYTKYGLLESEIEYKDGVMEGVYKEYNTLGKISTETRITKKEPLTEWVVNYFPSGKVKSNGWRVNNSLEGKWEIFHENGKLRQTEVYLNGQLNGPVVNYFFNGKISDKLFYKYDDLIKIHVYDTLGTLIQKQNLYPNEVMEIEVKNNFGKPKYKYSKVGNWFEGDYKSYYGNGKLSAEGNYKSNQIQGEYKQYHENGKLKSTGTYNNGRLNGAYTEFYANGEKESYGEYKDDNPIGKLIYYYDNGEISSLSNYENGIRDGASEWFDRKGNLQMVRYYENGKVVGYAYHGKDGKLMDMIPIPPDGTADIQSKFPNGEKSRTYTTKNNIFDGKILEYSLNGNVSEEANYLNDIRNGERKEYYYDGTLKSELNYELNDKQGAHKTYYPNGKIKAEINYIFGYKHGNAYYYNENGVKTLSRYYYYGTIVNEF